MGDIYTTVRSASGKVSGAVYLKAAKRLKLTAEYYRIGEEFFVQGYRGATVAKHFGVTRQRVHAVCQEVLIEINKLLTEREP